ncbi:hypothetical protein H9Q10_03745 [Eikenella sp. S3360]|uniref:Uncharacterized protein n=2 Tax=Eikenella glucosivorans TaxID=2766967 RepID=A0ABS0N932_9NEIS|nr:hypothetical protein [Eikenella glucosivorans]
MLGLSSPWNERCPEPTNTRNGNLVLEDGRTLKCQIRAYTRYLGCSERFTNPQGDDGLACTDGEGKGVIFFFHPNGVLKSHEFLQK